MGHHTHMVDVCEHICKHQEGLESYLLDLTAAEDKLDCLLDLDFFCLLHGRIVKMLKVVKLPENTTDLLNKEHINIADK